MGISNKNFSAETKFHSGGVVQRHTEPDLQKYELFSNILTEIRFILWRLNLTLGLSRSPSPASVVASTGRPHYRLRCTYLVTGVQILCANTSCNISRASVVQFDLKTTYLCISQEEDGVNLSFGIVKKRVSKCLKYVAIGGAYLFDRTTS
jgi:hypothetical protein